MSDSLIIIPTYNEKENIEKIIRKVFSLKKKFHVLIVDDGSPDKTSEIVKKLQKEYAKILFLGRHKRPACPNERNDKVPFIRRRGGGQ